MIVMALFNPVAFLLTVALGVGALFGLEQFGIAPTDDSWWDVVLYLGIYVVLMMFLPWWTRPLSLWRYWRLKRNPPHDPSLPPWAQR